MSTLAHLSIHAAGKTRQQGMTFLGWLLVLAIIGFFATIIFRLAPIYLEYYEVKSILESLRQEPYISKKTPAEVMQLLMKRFDIDAINYVTRDDIDIKQEGGRLTVNIEYEVRTPMMGNVDAVVKFKRSMEAVTI